MQRFLENSSRKILNSIGLTFEKDYAEADCMWVTALNHISHYLFEKNTPMPVIKNLIKLLVVIDPEGKEFINDWLQDWKTKNCKQEELARLNVICPIILKEQKKQEKELAELEKNLNRNK